MRFAIDYSQDWLYMHIAYSIEFERHALIGFRIQCELRKLCITSGSELRVTLVAIIMIQNGFVVRIMQRNNCVTHTATAPHSTHKKWMENRINWIRSKHLIGWWQYCYYRLLFVICESVWCGWRHWCTSGNNSSAQAICHLASSDSDWWRTNAAFEYVFVFASMTRQALQRCIIDEYAKEIMCSFIRIVPISFFFPLLFPALRLAFIANGLKSHTSYTFLFPHFVFVSLSSSSFAYKSQDLVLACRLGGAAAIERASLLEHSPSECARNKNSKTKLWFTKLRMQYHYGH